MSVSEKSKGGQSGSTWSGVTLKSLTAQPNQTVSTSEVPTTPATPPPEQPRKLRRDHVLKQSPCCPSVALLSRLAMIKAIFYSKFDTQEGTPASLGSVQLTHERLTSPTSSQAPRSFTKSLMEPSFPPARHLRSRPSLPSPTCPSS